MDSLVAITKANSKAAEDEIKLLEARAKYENAVAAADPHRSIARRMIAYLLVGTIAVVIPALIILFPQLQWFEIHTWTDNGFFGLGAKEIVEVVAAQGLPLVWLDGLLTFVATTVGFYFGNSSARFTNPYKTK